MAEPIFPDAPIIAIVCFVLIFLLLRTQNYSCRTPCSNAFGQEKALTFVNGSVVVFYFLLLMRLLILLRVSGESPIKEAIMCWGTR